MSGSIHTQSSRSLSLGKIGSLLFTRQPRIRDAKTHPGIISGLAHSFSAWRARRAAIVELSGLSDRELADIGLTRQQIPEAVYRNM